MRTLLAHLRKEWREHRAVLLGIAVAIPFLLAVGCAASNELAQGLELALHCALAAGTSLTVLALSSELWTGEARRDGLALLRRTPRAVGFAFAAKSVFFLTFAAATAGWTALACLASAEVFGDDAT